MKFTRRPLTISAWPVHSLIYASIHAFEELPSAVQLAYEAGKLLFTPDAILITSSTGRQRANAADWLVQGASGELYPCPADVFHINYAKV